MLNKMNTIVAFFFLSLSACIESGDDGGIVDSLCTDPFNCTPERACDITPVNLSFPGLVAPFRIQGVFLTPSATYGVADDAFLSVTWQDNRIEWLHIEQGEHTFSIEYRCEENLWTAMFALDTEGVAGDVEATTFEGSCSTPFNPSILAAPEVEFSPICTTSIL
jgi:hypothetical protein